MRPVTQEELFLFTLMGQVLLNIQVLEETLNASITLKIDVGYPRKISIEESTARLKQRLHDYTLGKAIKEAKNQELYSEEIQVALNNLLKERNWFIHRIVDDFYDPKKRSSLLNRLKFIATEAHRIQRAIEDDLISFAESNGLDMSSVKAQLNNSISNFNA
jgi:hypothetical protein